MIWWFGHVFVDRTSPERITLVPEYDEADNLKEKTAMLKIKLFFAFLKNKYDNYIDLRETRRALQPLGDHILHDIGLSQADLDALMHGRPVARQQVLTRLSKRRFPTEKALPLVGALPEALPALVQNVVANPGGAANDCEACVA